MEALSKNKEWLNDEALLENGIKSLSIGTENIYDKLLIYIDLLIKWNKTYNLTSLTSKRDIILLHLLDCLAVANSVKGQKILDVGSGAGLPGLIIAMLNPSSSIELVDKVEKKTAFIKQAKFEMQLKNVEVVNLRVEDLKKPFFYDAIISRAFSDINSFVNLTKHLIKIDGSWFAMKSRKVIFEDLNDIGKKYEIFPVNVPFLDAERYLVKIDN